MTILTRAAAALVAVTLCATAASAEDRPMEMKGMAHGAMAPATGEETPADKAFAASNAAMMKGMGLKTSGDADRDFVAMMLPHHQGAVDMARIELQYGKDPSLRKLAAAIIKAQAVEIAEMQAWQRRHAR